MKKYLLYIIVIPLAMLVLILCLFRKNENVKPISENKNSESEQSLLIEESMPDKYGGEVIQVGGVGSRIHQLTAYLIWEDVGYLHPAEDWVNAGFNSPAYKMDVWCRDGYKISRCILNDEDIVFDPKYHICEAMLEERIKNKVNIVCVKE